MAAHDSFAVTGPVSTGAGHRREGPGARASERGTHLNNLAVLYRAQGRYEAAEPLYQRALAIFEKALGPEHPNVVQGKKNYALMLNEMGRAPKPPLWKRLLGGLRRSAVAK